jgi:hypothetical protein
MDAPTDDRPRAAPPTLAGVVMVVLGGLAIFAAVVGYALADGRLSGWDRLADGSSFGLASSVVGPVGVVLVLVGLVLLGVGIGTARRGHHGHHQGPHPWPHAH